MALLIGIAITVFVIVSLTSKKNSVESTKNEGKSFFFEGGDDFTDEDYIFMEMMEDDN